MKKQLLFIALFVTTFLNAQSIEITSTDLTAAEVGSTITVNFKYSSTETDSYIYVGLNLYADTTWTSFVIGADTGVVNGPGTEITGSVSIEIPEGTVLTADLTNPDNYKLSVEMKEKVGWTLIASDYPSTELEIVAAGTLSTDSFTEELNKITIYPNPVSEKINIQNLNKLNISNIKIFNMLGKVVLSTLNSTEIIDVSSLVNGIYILSIKSEKVTKSIKFVKN
jgi:hypothetical protein